MCKYYSLIHLYRTRYNQLKLQLMLAINIHIINYCKQQYFSNLNLSYSVRYVV